MPPGHDSLPPGLASMPVVLRSQPGMAAALEEHSSRQASVAASVLEECLALDKAHEESSASQTLALVAIPLTKGCGFDKRLRQPAHPYLTPCLLWLVSREAYCHALRCDRGARPHLLQCMETLAPAATSCLGPTGIHCRQPLLRETPCEVRTAFPEACVGRTRGVHRARHLEQNWVLLS